MSLSSNPPAAAPKFKKGQTVKLKYPNAQYVGKVEVIDRRTDERESFKGCDWSYDIDIENGPNGEPILYKHVAECDLEPTEGKTEADDVRAPISLEYLEAHSYSNFDENGFTILPKELDCEEDDIYDELYPDGWPIVQELERRRELVEQRMTELIDGTRHLNAIMEESKHSTEAPEPPKKATLSQEELKQVAITLAKRFAPQAKTTFPDGEVWLCGYYVTGSATKVNAIDIAIILPESPNLSAKDDREAYFQKTAQLNEAAANIDERIEVVVRSVVDRTGFVKAIFNTGIYIA